MLDRDELERAVGIQKRSYRLLRWLAEGIDRGLITYSSTHGEAPASRAAYDWIEEHYDMVPLEARPLKEDLKPFSNFFGSYVTTSFDLVEEPGNQLENQVGSHCYCPFCARVTLASHLQAKKIRRADKARAERLCASRLETLAAQQGKDLTLEAALGMIRTDPELKRCAAYSAYGLSLLERLNGDEGCVAVLALWRMIAWNAHGSPIRGFELEVDDMVDAEQRLLRWLSEAD